MHLERAGFSGHETFPFRYGWLRKAVELTSHDGSIFRREDAMVEMGVGKNMVRSIRHWGLATGTLEEDPTVRDNRGRVLRPSALGRALFGPRGLDEYLEDPASLWLLHWQLARQPSPATTWYWTFNHAPQLRFTKADLAHWLSTLVEQQEKSRVTSVSLKRDIDCFIRTYVPVRPSRTVPLEDTLDCPLLELGLIRERTKGQFELVRGDHPSLSAGTFAYALAEFLRSMDLPARTIPLERIALAPGSPGRVFCLSEDALLRRLERISEATERMISFDETAGMRQVLVHELPSPASLLPRIYNARPRGRAQA